MNSAFPAHSLQFSFQPMFHLFAKDVSQHWPLFSSLELGFKNRKRDLNTAHLAK